MPEVWIVDRDTKAPEVYVLEGTDYAKQAAGEEGWFRSPATGIQLRGEEGGKLGIQVTAEAATRRLLPED